MADLDAESSARVITPAAPALPRPTPFRPPAEVVALPGRVAVVEQTRPVDEPRYASRNWRAEAWERERERTLRPVDRRPGILARRRG